MICVNYTDASWGVTIRVALSFLACIVSGASVTISSAHGNSENAELARVHSQDKLKEEYSALREDIIKVYRRFCTARGPLEDRLKVYSPEIRRVRDKMLRFVIDAEKENSHFASMGLEWIMVLTGVSPHLGAETIGLLTRSESMRAREFGRKADLIATRFRQQRAELLLEDGAGGEINLGDYRGKVVLLNFWNTACSPCRTAMVKLEPIYQKYKSAGFEIVGVCSLYSDGLRGANELLRQNKITWKNGFLKQEDFAGKLGYFGPPEATGGIYFLIDQKGVVVGRTIEGNVLEYEVCRLLKLPVPEL